MADRTPSLLNAKRVDSVQRTPSPPIAEDTTTVAIQQDLGVSPKPDEFVPEGSPHTVSVGGGGGVVRRTRERREGQDRLVSILKEVTSLIQFEGLLSEGTPAGDAVSGLSSVLNRLKSITLVPSGGESAAAQFVAYVYAEAKRTPEGGLDGYSNRYRQVADELLRADELMKLLRETILGACRRFRPDAPSQQSTVAWRHYLRQIVELRAELEEGLSRSRDLVRTLPPLSEEEQEQLAVSPRSRQFVALQAPTRSLALEEEQVSEFIMSSPPPAPQPHHERPDTTPARQELQRNYLRPPRHVEDEVFQTVTGSPNHRIKDANRMHRAAEDALDAARQTVSDLEDENHHLRASNTELRRQMRAATDEVESAMSQMEADFDRRAEHLVAREVAAIKQDCERRVRDVHAKCERTIADLQKNHKTSLSEQEEAWRIKVGLGNKDHAVEIQRVEADCKRKLHDMERDWSRKLREERERSQKLLDSSKALSAEEEGRKFEEALSRIKKRHKAVMADLERKLSEEQEVSQQRKKELENTKLFLADSERRRESLEAQLTEATRKSKDLEGRVGAAVKERAALERDTEYLMTELLSLQQTVSEFRREQRSINAAVNNAVSVRRESEPVTDKRRVNHHAAKSGASTPREPSRALFDDRSPMYLSSRPGKAGWGGGHERGTSPTADSLHCPSSVLNQNDDDAMLGSLMGSAPSSPTRRHSSSLRQRHSPKGTVRRGEGQSPRDVAQAPITSSEFQVSPATDDRHPTSGSGGAMSPSVRRVLAAARGALHEVRSSGNELSRTGTGATGTSNDDPLQQSKRPQPSDSVRSASTHSSSTSNGQSGVVAAGVDGFQSELAGVGLPRLMELEANMTEELALLEDKESLVKDKRMSVSTTLLAQRNQLLMKNAPEADIERLNDKISTTMERVNAAMGQIQDRRRRTQNRISLVRAEMLRKRRPFAE